MLKTVSSIANAIGALNYKGTWNASTNTPTITSGAGVKGDYYVVSVAGSTTIDGLSNWGVGDWVTFNGSVWQRVEGGADLNGVNLSVSGVADFASGTVTNPAITKTGDTDTGVFFPAPNAMAIAIGGVEITRSVDGKHGVGTTSPQQLFSVGGGGIVQKALASVPITTPTEILRAAGFPVNSNGASVYKVNVIATTLGAATRVKEFIWMVQVFQSSPSRTLTQIYDYEANLNAGNRRLDFTITASKTGDDEILTLDLSSSGAAAPSSADIIVYAEAYGGRADFVAGRSHPLT